VAVIAVAAMRAAKGSLTSRMLMPLQRSYYERVSAFQGAINRTIKTRCDFSMIVVIAACARERRRSIGCALRLCGWLCAIFRVI